MPTIDQPASEPPLSFSELVKMDSRRILVKAGCELVLGFFHGHAMHMVDALARQIVGESSRAAGERVVVGGAAERWAGCANVPGCNQRRQGGHVPSRRRGGLVPLSHHYPTDIFK